MLYSLDIIPPSTTNDCPAWTKLTYPSPTIYCPAWTKHTSHSPTNNRPAWTELTSPSANITCPARTKHTRPSPTINCPTWTSFFLIQLMQKNGQARSCLDTVGCDITKITMQKIIDTDLFEFLFIKFVMLYSLFSVLFIF